ncbi:uncharacterized protein LOC129921128 [Episyrphus balteatus]|uniref:uncharacterized protein LOC129921128 n=1 Tax=Episyrphus balteatus TaxID=286459 RepID=UPI002484F7FB|nr:uncharacterized protein LOC129921128 [Episyrphus balteatus]
MALTINKCCCCISLPTACIIVGVLGGVFSLIKSIECLTDLYDLHQIGQINGHDDETARSSSKYDIYYVLVPNIVYVITSVLLIIGIKKNSHLMLLPWIIINVIVLLLYVPIILFFFYYADLKLTTRDILKASGIFGLVFVISFWIWISVYSLFKEIRSKRNEQLPENEKNLINLYPRYEIVQLNV